MGGISAIVLEQIWQLAVTMRQSYCVIAVTIGEAKLHGLSKKLLLYAIMINLISSET